MPNASGFVDFNQYYDQNKGEEERLMQEAMDRARGSDAAAQSALAKAKTEAGGRYSTDDLHGTRGQIVGEQADITKTASYGAYLEAKKAAENAYAGIGAPSNNPFADAVHGAWAAGSQLDEQAKAGMEGLNAREDAARGWAVDTATGLVRQRGEAKSRADAKAQADEERAASDAQHYDDYRKSLSAKMKEGWSAMDRKQGSLGFDPRKSSFTFYGENMQPFGQDAEARGGVEGDPDAKRLIQQAENAGLGEEAKRYQSGATYEWGKRTKGGY